MFEQEMSSPVAGLDEAWSSYAPGESLREQACVFPACRQPAERYDVDLRALCGPDSGPAAESGVDIELWPLCREHFRLKQEPGWTVSRHPTGSIIWRSPGGRHHVRHVDRSRRSDRVGRPRR